MKELKDARFFSLHISKSSAFDDISFTVIKNCFGELFKPLLHIFNLSLVNGIFPAELFLYSKVMKKGAR